MTAKFEPCDAVLWDNRRLLHAGTTCDLDTETRLMHRTTIRETAPIEMVSKPAFDVHQTGAGFPAIKYRPIRKP